MDEDTKGYCGVVIKIVVITSFLEKAILLDFLNGYVYLEKCINST